MFGLNYEQLLCKLHNNYLNISNTLVHGKIVIILVIFFTIIVLLMF